MAAPRTVKSVFQHHHTGKSGKNSCKIRDPDSTWAERQESKADSLQRKACGPIWLRNLQYGSTWGKTTKSLTRFRANCLYLRWGNSICSLLTTEYSLQSVWPWNVTRAYRTLHNLLTKLSTVALKQRAQGMGSLICKRKLVGSPDRGNSVYTLV